MKATRKATPGNGTNPGGAVAGLTEPDRYARQTRQALASGLRLQGRVALAAVLVAAVVNGTVAATSAFCGALAVYLPSLAFTWRVGRRIGGDSAAFLRTAALAEFGKLAGTGLLCAAAFVWLRPLAAGWFFTGMFVVLAAGWVGLGRAIR